MLIACPSCATSYLIDPADLGPAGRTVRCARCKTVWFAGGPHDASTVPAGSETEIMAEPEVGAFVDGVIAEAEAEEAGAYPPQPQAPAEAGAPEYEVSGGEAPEVWAADAPPIAADPDAAPAEIDEPPQTITEAPSLVPPLGHAELAEATAALPESEETVESFAARRLRLQSRRRKARRSSRWTALVLLLFAFNVALIGARNDIVRYLPQTASLFAAIGLPVNLRHLDFENVRITRENSNGTPVLKVQGSIVSTASVPVHVPRLRFAVRDKAEDEIYTWTMRPARSTLKPGERLDFHSSLASPPKAADDVLVRFFTANDAMAGGK